LKKKGNKRGEKDFASEAEGVKDQRFPKGKKSTGKDVGGLFWAEEREKIRETEIAFPTYKKRAKK